MFNELIQLFARFPVPFSCGKKLEDDLFKAGLKCDGNTYLAFCFGFSLAIFIFISSFAFFNLIFLAFGFLAFALSFFLLLRYPDGRAKRRAKEIEDELILELRAVGAMLNVGLPFELCLKQTKIFKKVLNDIENGASFQEALENFSDCFNSNFVKKAALHLIHIYEHGGDGEILKKIADEQAAINRAKIKEYNGKLAVFSLVFIGCSAIVPALFQAYIVLGSAFINIPPAFGLIFPIFVFPAINIAIFVFIRSRRP
jgi:pilus assembly protein TadC